MESKDAVFQQGATQHAGVFSVRHLRASFALLRYAQQGKMLALLLSQIFLGVCDLLLAASMYVLFILLQGGVPRAHRWWTPQDVLSASIFAILLLAVRISVDLSATHWTVRFVQDLYSDLLRRLMEGYGQMSWEHFVQRNRSEMLKYASSTALDAAYSYKLLIECAAGAVVVALLSTGLIYQSATLGISLGVITLLMYALHRFVLRTRLSAAAVQREDALRLLQKTVAETLSSGKEIRTYGNQPFFYEHIRRQASRIAASYLRLTFLPQVSKVLADQGVVLLFLGMVVAVELHHGPLRQLLSLLVFYFILSRRLLPMMGGLALAFGQLEGSYQSLRIITLELDDCARYRSTATTYSPPSPGFVLQLTDLSFSFERSSSPLFTLNLQMEPGEIAILRGASGSGKSSLLNIIAGVAHPVSGSIRVDRASVAYVPQEIALLDDSIRNNLLFGLPPIPDSELLDSLAAVNLSVFVASLPAGLETRIGDNGVLFSGGQRQRLGIARAILRKVTLLLLDEATAALDERNERDVLRSLAAMKVAILMVTHRIHDRGFAGRILRLERGTLIEEGIESALQEEDVH